jgi:hypothetical protein
MTTPEEREELRLWAEGRHASWRPWTDPVLRLLAERDALEEKARLALDSLQVSERVRRNVVAERDTLAAKLADAVALAESLKRSADHYAEQNIADHLRALAAREKGGG